MAYSATKSVTRLPSASGVRLELHTVVETGVTTNAHEYTIAVPTGGEITSIDATLAPGNGTGTTIDPQLGETSNGTEVYANGSGAASVRDRTTRRFVATGNVLYGRSVCDGTTGTTGNITTRIVVRYGHGG